MRRSLPTLTLALALPACAPPLPPQPWPRPVVVLREVRPEVEQVGTRLEITVHASCSMTPEWARNPPRAPRKVDGKTLAVGLGFLGLSAPFYALTPYAGNGRDRAVAALFGAGFTAVGAVLVGLSVGRSEPVNDPLPAPAAQDAPCPAAMALRRLPVELRPVGAEHVELGETDTAGRLTVDLLGLDPAGFGAAASAPIYVDGREVGTVDLSDAARAKRPSP